MRSEEKKLYEEIGARIREAREQKGLSQGELGTLVGYTHAAISGYERGKSKVSIFDLVAISRALGRSVPWFLGEPENAEEAQQQVVEQTKRQLTSRVDEMVAAMLKSSLADPMVDALVQRLNGIPADQRHRIIESFLTLLPPQE